MNVLIVDDSEDVRSFLKMLLRDQGHAVREAGNGQEGLARAREQRPDAIICDGLMPVMDGFQLLQALKKEPGLASIPFLFHSAVYTGQREQDLARSLGADAFLVKPQPPVAIVQALRDATAGGAAAARDTSALTGNDTEFAREYSRTVATALEEKVGQFEHVTRDLERTKKELQESEAAYRGLFENNPQPMWVYALETLAFLAVNDAAISSYGFSREEFLAMTIKDIRRPEDAQKLISRVSAAADGFDAAGIWRHRKKDGTIIDVEITSHTLEFSGQRAKQVLANDVTERSRMEKALRHAADEWRATVDAMTEAVALLDADGRLIRCNKAMTVLTGKSYAEIIGRACDELCARFAGGGEEGPFIKCKTTLKREYALLKNGDRWFEASADPIVDETGTLQGAVHILQDITERRKAEASLQAQRVFNENLLRHSAIATFVLDAGHKVLIWNKACEELTGVPASDMVGTDLQWKPFYAQQRPVLGDIVLGQAGESIPALYSGVSKSVLTPEGLHGEGWFENLNNKKRYIVFDAAPIRDSAGNVAAAIETLQDFTGSKKLEEQIHRAKQDWEHTFNSITDMVTIHDAEYNIILANKAAEKIQNLPILEKKGRKCFAYHGTDHAPEGCPSCECLQTGVSASFEVFEPHLNMFIEIRAIPRLDSNNKLIGLIHVVRDITARKNAEKNLMEERNKAQLYLDIAGVLIVALDAGGRVALVNKRGLEITGYEEQEMTGRSWFDLCIPAPVREEVRSVFKALMAGDTKPVEYFENVVLTKDGSERVLAFHNAVVRSESGGISGILFSGEDITERKRAQDALNERVHQAALGAEIGVALTTGGDLRAVLQHCAEAMVRHLDAAFARIWTLNEKDNVLEMQASAGRYTHLNGPHGRISAGEKSKIGLIAEERKPHLTNQVLGDPLVGDQEWVKKEGMVAFAGYPLIVQDRLVGVMAMFSRKQLAETTMHSVGSVADIVALGIERKRAEESLSRYSKELTELNTASNTLMIITNLTDIYAYICDIIYGVFDLKMVWLGIAEPDGYAVKPVAHSGHEDGYLSSTKVTWDDSLYGKGPTGMAVKTKKSFAMSVSDPACAAWSEHARQRGYVASLAVPLIYARDKCLGALNFYSDDPGYFSSDRIKLCEIFANQAAIAIENARLVEGLETNVFERTRALEDTNRELVLRREEAEAASRSKTDFLANMSHELRTPLNAIMGFSEIMLMGMAGPVSDKQKEFLGDISKSGNHLLSLINDILDLSKVEAGKMELEPELVIIGELISGSLMMFKEKALKHGIRMETFIDPAVTQVVADRRKLKQVLVNLLSNAFKFTPDGGSVSVHARIRSSSEAGKDSAEFGDRSPGQKQERLNSERRTHNAELHENFIEISVADTGVGIAPEHVQKLFQPFQQIDSSLTRKYAGTGLGLSLCRRFVELHGGGIWVESEPGKGSTFRFVIPVRRA